MHAFMPLVYNAALLVGVAALCDAITPLRPKIHRLILDLAVGLLGVGIMLTPWVYDPERSIVFDTRSILLGISGLYLGLVPTAIAMGAMTLMRLGYGGEGASTGIAVILVSGLFGIGWRHIRRKRLGDLSWVELYVFGVILQLLMVLLLMLGFSWATFVDMMKEVALPRMLIFPIGTAALGAMMTNHLRRSESAHRLRESEEQISATLYAIGDGVISADAGGRVVRLNQAAQRLTGWSEAEAKEKNLGEVFEIINEETLEPVDNPAEIVLREGVVVGLANHTLLITRDGTERPIDGSASPIFGEEGEVSGVVLVFSDQVEARAASKALEESERRFRAIFEQTATGVAEVDIETGRHLRVNAQYCRITRYTDEQMLDMSFWKLLHADDYRPIKDLCSQLSAGEIRESDAEARYIRSDGSVRWVSAVVAALWGEDEEPTRMVLTLQDVTDHKMADEAVLESNRRLATLMDNLQGMAYRCVNDKNWSMEFVSKGAADLTGYQPEDLFQGGKMPYGDIILPEDRDRVWHSVQAGLQKRSQFQVAYQIRTASGSLKWVDERGMGVFSDSGELVALEGLILDITEQTHAQIALREAERFARSTIDALPSHLCVLDGEGKILATNSAWRSFAESNSLTTAGASVGANYLAVCDAVGGLDRCQSAALASGIRAVLSGKVSEYAQEYACHSPDQEHWFIGRVTRFPGSGDIRVVVNHISITDRKVAERALTESEARFRAVVEALPEALFVQVDGRFAYVNPATAKLFGAPTVQQLIGELIVGFVHHDCREQVRDEIRNINQQAMRVSQVEQKVLRIDGSVVDVEVSAIPFVFGGANGALVFMRDTTLRKRAEREMARAADFSLSLLKKAPALIWRATVDKNCDWFNETWLRFTGRTLEQEAGDGWVEGVHPEDVSRCVAIYCKAFDARAQFSMEYRLRRHDGVYRWILDFGIPYDDLDGNFSGYIGYCFDISELKQAEQALRGMAAELRLAEERERRRLAEHLHDEVCQILSLAQIKLSMTRQHEDDRARHCASAEELIIRANRSLRSLLMEMSNPVLYELGFTEGVEWLVEDMDKLYGLKVRLENDKSFAGMDLRVRVVLFQCLRELLANVAKHSGVSEAVARLYTRDGKACVEVQDAGRGFVVDRLEEHTTAGGFGLFSIRERLRNFGGEIEIRSESGAGTVVFLSIFPHNEKHEPTASSAS